MKPINFFVDTITLNVHSATNSAHLGLTSISDFIDYYGESVKLYELENKELHVEANNSNSFMTGVEV